MTPFLIRALQNETLSGNDKAAFDAISSWNYRMDTDSTAATIWWTFWRSYLAATFDPWWKTHNVKVDRDEGGNSNPINDMLGQDLEAWTERDPTNPAFTLIGSAQNANDVMRSAFQTAVKSLGAQLGSDPKQWTWGRVHERTIENLAQITGLDYGPLPDRGDRNTPLAAPDFPSSHGPSWRMVVDWGARSFDAIYPGGQSENPASGWYSNHVTTWWEGKYSAMLDFDHAASSSGSVVWSLQA